MKKVNKTIVWLVLATVLLRIATACTVPDTNENDHVLTEIVTQSEIVYPAV